MLAAVVSAVNSSVAVCAAGGGVEPPKAKQAVPGEALPSAYLAVPRLGLVPHEVPSYP